MTKHTHPEVHLLYFLLTSFFLGVITLVVIFPSHVSAHALMVRSEPEDGQVLSQSPGIVSAWFSQELETRMSSMRVFDSDGSQIDNGDGGADLNDLEHKLMTVSLPASLPEDTYTVRWSVVSAEDDDSSQGEFTFIVGEGSGAVESVPQTSSPNSGVLIAGIAIGGLILLIVLLYLIRRQRTPNEAD
jgi:copper transport protein